MYSIILIYNFNLQFFNYRYSTGTYEQTKNEYPPASNPSPTPRLFDRDEIQKQQEKEQQEKQQLCIFNMFPQSVQRQCMTHGQRIFKISLSLSKQLYSKYNHIKVFCFSLKVYVLHRCSCLNLCTLI